MSLKKLGNGFWYDAARDVIYKQADADADLSEDEVNEDTAVPLVPEVKATIVEYTEDGIVGRATCNNCGSVVLRRDRYCWNCGALFINSTSYFWREQWKTTQQQQQHQVHSQSV